MPHLVIATRNAHKVEEIRAVLGGLFDYSNLRDIPGAPDPEETGATFADNARIKAHALAGHLLALPEAKYRQGYWVLADDSGLEIDALQGAPGVRSARFAAEEFGIAGNAPDAANNAKVLRLLAGTAVAERTARFRCALALTSVAPGLPTQDFDGACEGTLGVVARGAHGFGYDPLFTPLGFDRTFAELGETTKNAISHRARALEKLRTWIASSGLIAPP
jgi:XTP/dITP diphosphohydrolase